MRAADDIQGDCKIIDNEIGRVAVIGVNTTDEPGSEEDCIGPHLREPGFGRALISQIEHAPLSHQDLAALACKSTDDCRSDHAAVAGNIDPPSTQVEKKI